MKKLLLIISWLCLVSLTFAIDTISSDGDPSLGSGSFSTSIGGTTIHVGMPESSGTAYMYLSAGATQYGPDNDGDPFTMNADNYLNESGNGFGLDVTSGYSYVFKSPSAASNQLYGFEVQGSLTSVSSLARDINIVTPVDDVTVNVTLSGALNLGESVYLAYSNDNWTTSTFIEGADPTGNVYSFTIPAAANSSGSTVKYYAFTSAPGMTFADRAESDYYTFSYNNNNSNYYIYIVENAANVFYTNGGGTYWNSANSWNVYSGGSWVTASGAPTAGAVVIVRANDGVGSTIIMNVDSNSISKLRIDSGCTLLIATASLANTLYMQNGAVIENHGTFTHVNNTNRGTINFAGTASVTGLTTVSHVVLAGGAVDLGSGCTVQGTLTINNGGSITGNAPSFSSTSTLKYDYNGGSLNRGLEWSATSGAGYPYNVLVTTGTTFNLGSGTSAARRIAGALTVDGTFTMNAMTAALTVTGNISNNGTLTLSSASGGNLTCSGTFTQGSSATFASNNRNLTLTNVALNGAMDFGTGTAAVSGTLTISNGGSVSNHAPSFGTSATLTYNQGGSATTGTEWSATSGAGYPRNVTLANSTSLTMSDAGHTMAGNLTIGSGSTLTLSASSGNDLAVKGNFANNGTFNANGRMVAFTGLASQSVSGSSAISFAKMRLSNSAGLNLSRAITVAADLSLNSGKVTLGAYNLTMGEGATITAESAFSSTNMIDVSGTGAIIQQCAANSTPSSGNRTYPMGNGSNYSPASITLNSSSTGDNPYLTIDMVDAAHPSLPGGAANYLTRYWQIVPTGFNSINVDLSFRYVDADITGDENSIYAAEYAGSVWSNYSIVDAANNIVQFTGISTLNEFTGADGSSPTIALSGSVNEGAENGNHAVLTLSNGQFVASLTPASWTISNLPAGVTAAVTRQSNTVVWIEFTGNRTVDYDTSITDLTVTVPASELVTPPATDLTVNTGFTFVANNDAESLSLSWTDGTQTEATLNGEQVTVTLNGGTFVQGQINTTNVTLSGTATSAGISMGSVSYSNATQIIITLAWNGNDFDASRTLQVNVAGSAYDDGDTSLSNTITVTATDDSEDLSSSDWVNPATMGAEATNLDNDSIDLVITGGNFVQSNVTTQYITASGVAGLTVESVSYVNSTHVTVNLAWDGTDYDADQTLTINVTSMAYVQGTVTLTKNFTIVARNEQILGAEASLDFGTVAAGEHSYNNFDFYALTLIGNATVTAPSGWMVSETDGGPWTQSVTVSPDASGNIADSGSQKVIYIEFNPTASQSYGGNLTITSAGATTVNVALSGTGADPSITLSGTANEGSENGAHAVVTLSSGAFVDPLSIGNWTVTNMPTGVTFGSVTRVSDTVVWVNFSGNRTYDYDSDLTNLSVSVDTDEFVSAPTHALSANTGFTFVANNDAENLDSSTFSTPPNTNGAELTLDDEVINLVISGGNFIQSQANNTNITASGVSGVTVQSVVYVSSTTLKVNLAWNGTDFDTNSTLTINVAAAAYTDASGTLTKDFTLVARNEQILGVSGSLAFGDEEVDSHSDVDFTFYATSLTDDVTITAPTGWTVSASASGPFTNSVNVAADASGNIATSGSPQTMYLRFAPTAVQSYSGNVTFTSDRAVTRNMAVTGNGTGNIPAINPTASASGILWHRAYCGANLTSLGSPNATSYGLVWSTSQNPTTSSHPGGGQVSASGPSVGSFTMLMSDLSANTTYYVRAYVTSSLTTVYADQSSFTSGTYNASTSVDTNASNGLVSFSSTPLALNFSGVSGNVGNDLRLDEIQGAAANPGSAYLSGTHGTNRGNHTFVITNYSGFTFTSAQFRLNVEALDQLMLNGVDQSEFASLNEGDLVGIYLWHRSNYASGDLGYMGQMRFSKGPNATTGDSDDYIYLDGITSFSEFALTGDGDQTLPVELVSFNISQDKKTNYVKLEWVTQTESNMLGYYVFRSESIVDRANALLLNANEIEATNEIVQHGYSFTDNDVAFNSTYYYWLQKMELDGTYREVGPLSISVVQPADNSNLQQNINYVTGLVGNYPNPFNPDTNIKFYAEKAGHVSIDIFNARGQLVRSLSKEVAKDKSFEQVYWNGTDNQGRRLGSGVYMYRMSQGSFRQIKKMIMLK